MKEKRVDAIILSILTPGLGQVYNGHIKRGIVIYGRTGGQVVEIRDKVVYVDGRVTIPVHSKDIPRGTLANIIRQACMIIDEFIDKF